jgi:CRISPR/Cas system endoribonuclease Cas6 (RAMP superfamily)
MYCIITAGQKNDDPTHIDFVPSVFTFKRSVHQGAVDRYRRLKDRQTEQQVQQMKKRKNEADREQAATALLNMSSGQPRFLDNGQFTLNIDYSSFYHSYPEC